MVEPRLVTLTVGGDEAAWADAGFTLCGDALRLSTVTLHVDPGTERIGTWALSGVDEGLIDGLATVAAPEPASSSPPTHANGATSIDHLVVTTPDLDRTTAALERAGLVARRTRDAGAMHQRFFRMGEVILEVVGPPETDGTDPATFWGLALTVDDLEAAARLLGDRMGPIKDAVQPGRGIATLRHHDLGLPCPIALMSPESHP
jgi:hypothetical protein